MGTALSAPETVLSLLEDPVLGLVAGEDSDPAQPLWRPTVEATARVVQPHPLYPQRCHRPLMKVLGQALVRRPAMSQRVVAERWFEPVLFGQ